MALNEDRSLVWLVPCYGSVLSRYVLSKLPIHTDWPMMVRMLSVITSVSVVRDINNNFWPSGLPRSKALSEEIWFFSTSWKLFRGIFWVSKLRAIFSLNTFVFSQKTNFHKVYGTQYIWHYRNLLISLLPQGSCSRFWAFLAPQKEWESSPDHVVCTDVSGHFSI